MNKTEIADYNLAELKGLLHSIDVEIKGRRVQDVRRARDKVLSIVRELGVPLDVIFGDAEAKPVREKTGTVAPRYRNPADNTQTWTGRGRRPKWVVNARADGRTMDDLRI